MVIKSFKHYGLEQYYRYGNASGIQQQHKSKLRMQLAALDTAQMIEDLDIPGYRLHRLKGRRKNVWSISVNGNWRLTFEFKAGDVHILNYEDYH